MLPDWRGLKATIDPHSGAAPRQRCSALPRLEGTESFKVLLMSMYSVGCSVLPRLEGTEK